MRDIRNIITIVCFCFLAQAQSDSVLLRDASGKTLKKLGKSALKQNDPTTAITFLEAYVKTNQQDAQGKYMLGNAYLGIRDYERAQRMFLNAYNTNKEKAPEALYYHAQMQKSNGQYDSAKISFQRFRKEYKGKQKNLKRLASKEIVFCDSVQVLMKNESKTKINRLDSTINKVNAEGAPVHLDEKTILYTSYRTDKREYIIEDDTAARRMKKVYKAVKSGDKWIYSGEYKSLNDPDFNSGNVAFSPDRKKMYFTKCKQDYREKMICAIYVSTLTKDGWSEPVKLPKAINHPRYTSTMPAVTSDAAKGNEMLYFVSDRKGGKGGLDIWYTTYDKKKKVFKPVKNAGNKINTVQNEITPYFDNETRTFYFSSDGWGGLGGYDIYRAKGDGRRFTGSENIGPPLNSGADDIYYVISPERKEGFFVSNRKGGAALVNSTCCDDIYSYTNPDYIQIDLEGTVLDMIDPTLPVPDAIVDVYIKDATTGDKFLVKTTKTDKDGNYKTTLETDQDYMVIVRKKELLGNTDEVSTKGIKKYQKITRTTKVIKKPKQPVPVPNIEYEFGKAELTPSSKKALDAVLLSMLEANPEIIVEVAAHTDSKGSELFNEKLSQKRADQIVQYIISKGISPQRIIAKGYGESMPIAPNEHPDGKDNPEGRAKNRRTEFKIVGTVETEETEETLEGESSQESFEQK